MEQFLANGFCRGAVIALVALGFGLIYTTTRVFHIAHAAIYVLGAYALYAALVLLKLPFPIAIVFSILVAGVAGMFVDCVVYQPLSKHSASAAVLLISSLGVQIISENLIALGFGNQTQILRPGVERTFTFGSVILTQVQIAQAIAGVVLTGAFMLFLKHSRTGQLCRAIADDETLASVLGVRVSRVRLLVFGVGSAFAATGSMLVALDVGTDPHVGFSAVLTAAVACIIGGLRNFLAPAVGGVLLGLTQGLVVWRTSAKWEEAVTFGILIVFLLFRRQGLFGVVRRAERGSMNYIYHIVVMVCLYATLAQSLNLVVGYGGLLSLSHAAFYGLGAYIASILMLQAHWPFLFSLIAAVAAVGLLAWVVSTLATRLHGDFFVLATLGFQMIVFAILYNWVGVTRGPYGISGVPRPSLIGLSIVSPLAFVAFTLIITIGCCGVLQVLLSSPYGRTLQAIREDEIAAASLGKDVNAFKRSAFIWAGSIAAVPGTLFATYAGYIDPTSFGLEESIFILCVLIIGGAGNLRGPIVGAVVLVLLPELLRFIHIPDGVAANVRRILYGCALVLVMRFRPQGIAGKYAFD